MKVLLIYPRYREISSSLSRVLENKIPPLGLLYIASALRNKGHEVKIIDAEEKNLNLEQLGELSNNFQPQIIGISTTTPAFRKARETAKYFKSIMPNISVVFGGPHLASFPKISLEFEEIDYGVIGEGEITICELMDALERKQSPEKIKGIVFRKNNQIIQTEPREMIQNLDEISLPAWDLIDVKKYQGVMSKKAFATMISSRGCPYNCFWCDPEGRFGKIFRGRSANNILKEIELLHSQYQIKEILFYDDTFTVDRERIVGLCNKIIDKNWNLIWECRTRVNLVDEELIKLMARAGCCRIRFGVESGNDEILKFVRKNITKDQARKAFFWSKKYKIETFAYFMLGLPTETEQTMQETVDFAMELKPDYAMFSPTLVFNQGNDMFKWAAENGYIDKDYWIRYALGENLETYPVLNTPQLPKEKIIEFTKKAYRKFYLNPHFIFKTIKKINSFKKLINYFSLALEFMSGNFKG
jgi:anaerobic magnesium-protoporphyrin IX monomethyl ester cyclase